MKNKIEAFYTGGGIYLCTTPEDKKHYYLISSEYPEDFTLVKGNIELVDWDQKQDKKCFYKNKNELTKEQLKLYEKMLKELKKEMEW